MNQLRSHQTWEILESQPAQVILAGIICFLLAIVCMYFAKASNYISIWVVNAVLLIFIFRSTPQLQWWYFLAGLIVTFIANLLFGATPQVSAAFAIINSIEIFIPMLLVPRKINATIRLHALNRQTIFLAISLPIGCLLSSFLATTQTVTLHDERFFTIFFSWFTTDLLAMVSILPLGLSFSYPRLKHLASTQKIIELITLSIASILIVWLSTQYIQIKFIIILMPMLFAGFRFGLLGTSIIFLITSITYVLNNVLVSQSDSLYTSTSELISYRSLLLCITLIPAVVNAILIEERDEFNATLKESEERFRNAIKYSALGVALVSLTGKWIVVNPALCAITGYTEDELMKLTYRDITYPEDLSNDTEQSNRVISNEISSYTMEKRYIRKSGDIVWISLTVSAVHDRENKPLYFVTQVEDISARKKMETELKFQASHDTLTGLINRKEAETEIDTLIHDARTTTNTNSLFFIDLDNFKTVNDTAGHAAGDELLRKIAELLQNSVRKSDSVARLGGDEFAVILPSCSHENAIKVANEIVENIKKFKFYWDNKSYEIGVSIGIVTFKPMETSLETLLSHADIACYTAKNLGGNRVSVFKGNKSEASQYLSEIQLGPKIKKYLEYDLFRIYAQEIKQLNSNSNQHLFYEILLRMVDDHGNMIMPATFIKSAERLDLLTEIDQWVIHHILFENADQILNCNNLTISINISSATISSPRTHYIIDNYLSRTRLDTRRIGFEINDNAFSKDMKSTQAFLEIIKKHRCFIVMENFGKGLGVLQYLRDIPELYTKVDRDLIRAIDTNPVEHAIVESINTLAHKLGAKTIAEFVESEAIMNKVKTMGIDYAQGHAIGEPLPLLKLLAQLQVHESGNK